MKSKLKLKTTLYYSFGLVFGLILLYPFLWMISSSFKYDNEIFQGTSFVPEVFRTSNYIEGWAGVGGVSFTRFFLNSLFLVGINIIGNVISCSLTAYAFAKREFRLKKIWFTLMLGTMMLPLHVTLIPQYVMFNELGWINTFLPLIVPNFFAMQGFFIFMMTQFMRGIPKEIDEASIMDGCGAWVHYTKIILPMSLPAIITTCIFTFIWTWNDFFSQMIYITNVDSFTISLALRQFVDAVGGSSWGALFAMSTLSLIPLFLIFVFLQKYLIEGVTAGSVKG
jgi:ABC-type sugar transport system, permease component